MTLVEWIEAEYPDEEILIAEGFDGAFIGVGPVPGGEHVAIYDEAKCIEILMSRDGMDHDEALEFFEFNVTGAYVGPGTPMFITRFTP